MWKKALGVFVVLIAVFWGVLAMQPDEFSLSRSTTINAAPDEVFVYVNDLHRWENWSPWAKLDPDMKTTYEGPESGEGASYSWVGNSEVGEGKMTIIKSQPAELIHLNLEFKEPMEGTNLTEFTFKPEGEGTLVTWTMTGRSNFIGKAFCLFVDMEEMLGAEFEKGLAQLKSSVEAGKPS